MAVTLSYGYILNQSGDRGNVFFPDLEFNIQRINDHNHDGVNSSLISSSSVSAVVQNVAGTGWILLANGNYHKNITVPLGVELDAKVPFFYNSADDSKLYLGYTIVDNFTMDVFSNDNTLALKVFYL